MHEGNKLGIRDGRLIGKGHEEEGVILCAGGNIHLDGTLITCNTRRTAGIETTIEEVIIRLGGIEHQHPLGRHTHLISDVREVLQIQIQRKSATVTLGIEDGNIFGRKAVIMHRNLTTRHRVGHLREIDLRLHIRHLNTSREVGIAPLALQHQISLGTPLCIRDDTRQDGVKQCHRQTIDHQMGVIAILLGRIETTQQRIPTLGIHHRESCSPASKIPTRSEAQGRCNKAIGCQRVNRHIGRHASSFLRGHQ